MCYQIIIVVLCKFRVNFVWTAIRNFFGLAGKQTCTKFAFSLLPISNCNFLLSTYPLASSLFISLSNFNYYYFPSAVFNHSNSLPETVQWLILPSCQKALLLSRARAQKARTAKGPLACSVASVPLRLPRYLDTDGYRLYHTVRLAER